MYPLDGENSHIPPSPESTLSDVLLVFMVTFHFSFHFVDINVFSGG